MRASNLSATSLFMVRFVSHFAFASLPGGRTYGLVCRLCRAVRSIASAHREHTRARVIDTRECNARLCLRSEVSFYYEISLVEILV